MIDDFGKYIEESFEEHSTAGYNYKITARYRLSDEPHKYVDVTGMFMSADELEEVSLSRKSRKIYAFNEAGFDELMEMGFSGSEIICMFNE